MPEAGPGRVLLVDDNPREPGSVLPSSSRSARTLLRANSGERALSLVLREEDRGDPARRPDAAGVDGYEHRAADQEPRTLAPSSPSFPGCVGPVNRASSSVGATQGRAPWISSKTESTPTRSGARSPIFSSCLVAPPSFASKPSSSGSCGGTEAPGLRQRA